MILCGMGKPAALSAVALVDNAIVAIAAVERGEAGAQNQPCSRAARSVHGYLLPFAMRRIGVTDWQQHHWGRAAAAVRTGT